MQHANEKQQRLVTAMPPAHNSHLAPLVIATVGETQVCLPWPPLALVGGLVVVLSHLEVLPWRELLCCRRVTKKAGTRRGAAQRTW